jgi:hypothetical protein
MNHKKVAGFDVIEHRECSFASAQEMVKEANAEAIGGYSDWVMPDTVTAQALRLVGGGGDAVIWSSTPGVNGSAWFVRLNYGNVTLANRNTNANQLRLVRASQCLALGQAAHRLSLAEAGIELDAAEVHSSVERPRGG